MPGQLNLVLAAARLGTAQRVGGAGVLGVVIAIVLAGIWRKVDVPHPSNPLDAIVWVPASVGAGVIVAAAGILAGFAWLQVRPLLLTVPAAVVAAFLTVRALVALAAAPGWLRLAGLLALGTLLATGWVLPAPVHDKIQRRGERARPQGRRSQ